MRLFYRAGIDNLTLSAETGSWRLKYNIAKAKALSFFMIWGFDL